MASLDSVGQHPLSLKVMRVSRPSLAAHWQPFFSSSPSFSAHSTANILSLQGAAPLQGHPKTLRDLSHAGQMLTLPAAFGAIQLGETFACVLCANNEAGVPVDGVYVKVEMQTVSGKVAFAETVSDTLAAGHSLETVVGHEIKELGQHVLACSVTYRTPPGMRPATTGAEGGDDPFVQTFRKFYKFVVTNPLSVKTKVHVPRSPTALLSRNEREKVFLEVHIQNLTQGPLWFEKIRLEAVDGWDVVDANIARDSTNEPEKKTTDESIFAGNMALMNSRDMRQYIYIMTPKVASSTTNVLVPPAPGAVIPLGRLDISWRSAMGEPGRLLTSVLSRRIPLLAPPPSSGVAPVSALPPYLQKAVLPGSPRPRSPSLQQAQQQQQRVATPPPQRSSSPLKRMTTPGPSVYPQSSGASVPPVPPLPVQPLPYADVEVDLVVLEIPADATVRVEEPFSLRFSLTVSATLPFGAPSLLGDLSPRKARILTLVIQHTFPAPLAPGPVPVPEAGPQPMRTLKKHTPTTTSFDTTTSTSGARTPPSRAGSIDVLTPRRVMSPPPGSAAGHESNTPDSESLVVSPTMLAARAMNNVGMGGLAERLRRVALSDALGLYAEGAGSGDAFGDGEGDTSTGEDSVRLPRPYSASLASSEAGEKSTADAGTGRVSFAGASAVFLPPISLTIPRTVAVMQGGRGEGSAEFSLSFLPRARGFARVGGLRVLLVEDREGGDGGDEVTLHAHSSGEFQPSQVRMLREWEVIAEVWVQ